MKAYEMIFGNSIADEVVRYDIRSFTKKRVSVLSDSNYFNVNFVKTIINNVLYNKSNEDIDFILLLGEYYELNRSVDIIPNLVNQSIYSSSKRSDVSDVVDLLNSEYELRRSIIKDDGVDNFYKMKPKRKRLFRKREEGINEVFFITDIDLSEYIDLRKLQSVGIFQFVITDSSDDFADLIHTSDLVISNCSPKVNGNSLQCVAIKNINGEPTFVDIFTLPRRSYRTLNNALHNLQLGGRVQPMRFTDEDAKLHRENVARTKERCENIVNLIAKPLDEINKNKRPNSPKFLYDGYKTNGTMCRIAVIIDIAISDAYEMRIQEAIEQSLKGSDVCQPTVYFDKHVNRLFIDVAFDDELCEPIYSLEDLNK